MCLIVDANVASILFSGTPSTDFLPIWDALRQKKAIAVHGGQLTREYAQVSRIRRLLIELGRQGILKKVSDEEVDAETIVFSKKTIQSDDPHILALAKVSRVRLLCSHDQNLHADFTNTALLRPLGGVYQNASHQHLLRKYCDISKQRRRRSRTKRR